MRKDIFTITIVLVLAAFQNFAQQKNARIDIGPNIQVSHDGNFTHAELMVAANPKDSKNIIVCTSTMPRKDFFRMDKLYVTKDGGKTWDDICLPDEVMFGGGDPQVAFANDGTAYFVGMIMKQTENQVITLSCYKSQDGGSTWEKPFVFGEDQLHGFAKGYYDHEQLAIDKSLGQFSGRIYVSGVYGPSLYFFYSEDNGKSFAGPFKIVTKDSEKVGLLATNLLVSGNGELFITYLVYGFNGQDNINMNDIYMASSKDGGVSFSTPQKVRRNNLMIGVGVSEINYGNSSTFAIDSRSEKYKDRLYNVFVDMQKGKSKIRLSYSKDGGESWSEAKLIDSTSSDFAYQYNASVTVNNKGIVGIRWYDTRETKKGRNEYFAVSLDGGDSFLPSVKVSSVTSMEPIYSKGIVIPHWQRSFEKDSLIISFGQEYFKASIDFGKGGGDYNHFVADEDGAFQDIWSDSRDGKSYQLYVSKLKVVEPDSKEVNIAKTPIKKKRIKAEADNIGTSKSKIAGNISKLVYVDLGFTDYDTLTNLLSIPLRVKNISNQPIYGPITFSIDKTDTSYGKFTIPKLIRVNGTNNRKSEFRLPVKGNVFMPDKETEVILLEFEVKIPQKKIMLKEGEKDMEHVSKGYKMEWLNETIADLYLTATGFLGNHSSYTIKLLTDELIVEKKYAEAFQMIKDNSASTTDDYNYLAWKMYENNDNLTLAKKVAFKGVKLLEPEKRARILKGVVGYSLKEVKKGFENYGAELFDTYGAILLRLGKNVEALHYMTLAYKMLHGNFPDVNERYMQALKVNGKNK